MLSVPRAQGQEPDGADGSGSRAGRHLDYLTISKLLTDDIVKQEGLADRLEAQDPPGDLEPVQSEAVSTWRRAIEASRGIRDKVVELGVTHSDDPVAFLAAIPRLDYTEASRLESQKDVLLIKLGGPGCKPSP